MEEPSSGTPLSTRLPEDRLDSWKEIAAYLNRDVTTVQRWEKREGMPVHRHLHDRIGSVYASKAELDDWAGSRRPRVAEQETPLVAPPTLPGPPVPSATSADLLDAKKKFALPLALLAAALAMAAILWIQRGRYLRSSHVADKLTTNASKAERATAAPPASHFEADTVVLADFTNSTGNPVFDDTLKQALAIALRQSPFLKVLSDETVVSTLQLMTLPKNTRLTAQVVSEICQRTGSNAYVAGSVASIGTEYVIGLKAVNCQGGDTLALEQVRAERKRESP
jgi:hypothetical protein